MEIRHYLTASGRDLFRSWLDGIRDMQARVAIQRRIDRLTTGNFGDHKFCRDGIWELASMVALGTGPITQRRVKPLC